MTSGPVETLVACPVAAIADRFEPGASRRILSRRPSIPSATTDVRTGPTASTTATFASRAASTTTSSDDPTASQTVRLTLRPCKTNGEPASRVKAFENDPRWLAKCTAARERRQQLAVRHTQDAKTRWQSAVRGPRCRPIDNAQRD
jgi:hypothetical protein